MSEGDGILIETILRLEEDYLKAEEDDSNSCGPEDRGNSPKRQVFMQVIYRNCQNLKS